MKQIKKCGQGHYGKVEGYYLKNYEKEFWMENTQYCVLDGSLILTSNISDEEFGQIYEEYPKTGYTVAVDWYELYCENNHRNTVGGYLNNEIYKFCCFCGKPIIKTVSHESRELWLKNKGENS